MKREWKTPTVSDLGVGNTMTLDCLQRDPGHNMPWPHIHHCDNCTMIFDNWEQANIHAQDTAKDSPTGEGHHVSCDIIS